MNEEIPLHWGMQEMPPLDGAPFALARSSCLHAVQVARDVAIDEAALQRFTAQLDVGTVRDILNDSMGENCDTVPDEFRGARDAVNFVVLFSLLQFGHGFRYELHRLCGRGAAQTITCGVRALHSTGDLGTTRLRHLTAADIQQAFQLPHDPALVMLVQQLHTVLHQAGTVLARLGLEDFAAFVQHALRRPEATLAVGELRRLTAPHDPCYSLSEDFPQAIVPVDNVIPAMLVYQGILRLSPTLHQRIHQQRTPLARRPQEAELRAVALAACERIVAAAGAAFTALNLGYYLWRSGKEARARQFARHHTKDTVFY